VRNNPDGSVELLAAGEPAAVDAVVEAARSGPPASRVDSVEVRPVAGERIPDTFIVT
jgi:acylphosphatase